MNKIIEALVADGWKAPFKNCSWTFYKSAPGVELSLEAHPHEDDNKWAIFLRAHAEPGTPAGVQTYQHFAKGDTPEGVLAAVKNNISAITTAMALLRPASKIKGE